MSVINQMLIDLERRRASGEERNRIPDHVRAMPGPRSSGLDWLSPSWIGAVLAVLLLAAATAAWWWRDMLPWLPAGLSQNLVKLPPADESGSPIPGMSFDLAQAPAAKSDDPPPVSTQSVIVSQAPDRAEPRSDKPSPPVVPKPAPAAPPLAPASSSAPASAIAVPETTAGVTKPAPAAPPQIDRREREQTPRQRAEFEFARGAAALHQGRASEARATFEAALQIEPALHGARQALVGVLVDARQPAEAIRVLQEGLQIAPSQSGFAMMLARLQVERGDLEGGVQTLGRSLEYAGGNADYLAFFAGLLQRQQRHADAIELFDRALRLRPGNGIWLLGLGMSLEAGGRDAEAREAFRRARASGNLPPDLQTYADQRLR